MANHSTSFLLFACLGACTSTPLPPGAALTRPTLTGSLPPAGNGDEMAPDDTSLPLGIGLTTGPSTILIGATLDFPVDKKITFGPSLHYGIDDNVDLMALTAQFKYFLSVVGDKDSFSVLPYITAGIGAASIDKEGRSGDSGLVIDAGAGVRYLTGDHYRIGSEARLNYLPDDLGGENLYVSLEILQIVVTF